MSKIKEIIVASVLPAIREVGKIEMKQVLAGVREHNKTETYQNVIKGLYANFSLLKEAASNSKTKIDDSIVDLILAAVKESADIDGIVLS
jgi:hypothetical protein